MDMEREKVFGTPDMLEANYNQKSRCMAWHAGHTTVPFFLQINVTKTIRSIGCLIFMALIVYHTTVGIDRMRRDGLLI